MDFVKDLVREVQEDDLMGGAAELAYRLLFAIFPFFLFLAAFSGYVTGWFGITDPTDRIISEIEGVLPEDASSVIDSQLRGVLEQGGGGLLSISALAALWAASSATKTAMKLLNRVYNVEESRPFIKKQLVGVGLTLLGVVGFVGGALVLVVGQVAGQEIAGQLGLTGVWTTVVAWARIPMVLLLLIGAMAVVYWLTPNADAKFKWISTGAVMFVVTWIVATVGFGIYVANFADYQATYGTIGGVIILMIWLYITSLVFLVGGKVNAVLDARDGDSADHRGEEAAIQEREREPVAANGRAHDDGHRNGYAREHAAGGASDGVRQNGHESEDLESGGRGPGITRRGATAAAGALLGAIAVRSVSGMLRKDGHHDGNGSSED